MYSFSLKKFLKIIIDRLSKTPPFSFSVSTVLKKNLCILACMALTCCNKSVVVQKSGIETPVEWKSAQNLTLDAPLVVDDCAKVEQIWWMNFDDPVLDALISIALSNNKTLAIAKARIEEARADRLNVWSTLFPQVNLAADVSKGNQGFYTSQKIYYFEDVAFQGNWELDLFGKNQARLAAANAILQSEQIARQAVIVGLLAEIGRNYFDLRNYLRQLAITSENLATQKQTLELTIEQLNGALASEFDVQRAAAQVSTTEARIPSLKMAFEITSNRLDVLLGSTPGQNDEYYNQEIALKPLDSEIVVAVPATVLATRPDVREAERRFAATVFEHKAALKEVFPTISLMGFFGAQKMTLFDTSPTWNIAANLVQPLIDFGKIQSHIQAAGARQKRAFFQYQEVVLEALENMENALTSYIFENQRNIFLGNAADQNRKALDLANEQYTNGYTALLDVLIVQRNALETDSIKAESDANLRKDLVNIYTASGGGWDF